MQAHAVQQLGFIHGHERGQAGCVGSLGVAVVLQRGTAGLLACHLGEGLHHCHTLQHGGHFFQRGGRTQAVQTQGLRRFHHCFSVALGQSFNQAKDVRAVYAAQHLAHCRLSQLARPKGNGLVRQTQSIAHRAPRCAGQQTQGLHFGADFFYLQHLD